MRATSRDVVATAFTLLIGLFVVIAMYMFGTGIFQAGARIDISGTNVEQSCACVSEFAKDKTACGGKTFACMECEKDELKKCKNSQTVKFEASENTSFTSSGIYVCANIFKAGDDAKSHTVGIYVGGSFIGQITKPYCMPCCQEFLFDKPKEVKEVRATASAGYALMNLNVELRQK